MHQVAFVASIPALAWLIVDAPSPRAIAAAWVYGLSMVALYLASSVYHLYARSPRARAVMKSLDHSMIFILIAGTYTPVCLLALRGSLRWILLGVVWTGALIGVVIKMFAIERYPKLEFGLYLVLGWAAVIALPALPWRPDLLGLAALGGLLYTAGAVLFVLHRPRPVAVWFGYHEFWHLCVVLAGAAFFAVNLALIAGG